MNLEKLKPITCPKCNQKINLKDLFDHNHYEFDKFLNLEVDKIVENKITEIKEGLEKDKKLEINDNEKN